MGNREENLKQLKPNAENRSHKSSFRDLTPKNRALFNSQKLIFLATFRQFPQHRAIEKGLIEFSAKF